MKPTFKRRHLRVLPKERGYYVHVTSRARGGAFLFGPGEKEMFVRLVRKWTDFSGVGVVTHCVLDNHFHLLLWVPSREEVDVEEVLRRLGRIWSKEEVAAWREMLGMLRSEREKKLYVEAVTKRMYDLPEMMRALKQSFSRWYNRTHNTRGALWEERYHSVVVESCEVALLSVSAYIDLNPVRANVCADPSEYRWCGYGEACGGRSRARQGLKHLVIDHLEAVKPDEAQHARTQQFQKKVDWREARRLAEAERQEVLLSATWRDVQRIYRCWLHAKGVSKEDALRASKTQRKRKGFSAAELEDIYAKQGEIPPATLLALRWTYFTKGVALGGEDFLRELFEENRQAFGFGRKKAAQPMKGGWAGLRVLRASGRPLQVHQT